ncbi:hypothetical protein D3C76_1557210 [compost metagenome]
MPLSAPVSTSVTPPNSVLTASPLLLVELSVRVVMVGLTGVITGASLTEVTIRVAWAKPVEYAVVLPLNVVSPVLGEPLVDAAPLVRSQARKVMETFSPLALSGM